MQDFVYIRETDGLTFQNGQIVSSQYYVTISLTSICFWNVKQSFLSILAPCTSPNPNNTHFDLRFFQVSPSGKIPFPKNDFSAAPDLHWYNYCNGMFSCYLET